jgi:hypothetical protein
MFVPQAHIRSMSYRKLNSHKNIVYLFLNNFVLQIKFRYFVSLRDSKGKILFSTMVKLSRDIIHHSGENISM